MYGGEIYERLLNFKPIPGHQYKNFYHKLLENEDVNKAAIAYMSQEGENVYNHENNIYLREIRKLMKTDLFFIVHFALGADGNDPKGFVLDKCYEIEADSIIYHRKQCDSFHYVWARGHFKSVTITICATAKYHLNYPEHCTCIFSFKKSNANKFLSNIADIYLLDAVRHAFPDILWQEKDWRSYLSMDRGLILKRRSRRKERSIETAGLVEGMPTGSHYNVLRFDDIETDDIAESPAQLNKAFSKFQMAMHLGMVTGDTLTSVAGTPYHHMGPVQKIKDLRDTLGVPTYKTTTYPAEDKNGQPVLMTRKQLDKFKRLDHWRAQMMCDPSPNSGSDFSSRDLKEPLHAPPGLYKFMIVDPAGDKGDKADGDYVAIMCVGAEKARDEDGFCNVYITDLIIERIVEKRVPMEIVKMFNRNSGVQAICIEQTNSGLMKDWVAQILQTQGVNLSEKTKTLIPLKPQGLGDKVTRIRRAMSTPFSYGKIHMLRSIPYEYRERMKLQLDQFPYSEHDDGPDCLSWYPRILATLNFNYMLDIEENSKRTKTDQRLPRKYAGCSAMAF